jgi:hypothetical protein
MIDFRPESEGHIGLVIERNSTEQFIDHDPPNRQVDLKRYRFGIFAADNPLQPREVGLQVVPHRYHCRGKANLGHVGHANTLATRYDAGGHLICSKYQNRDDLR